ncbi:uncharacterized protein LACBIDRAFT_330294 [Laccaria bicolor S238N-H82]|uniref:Predicted protein n=1 Tax=Laccaria bicolor (strain S238N-H82 / ATCC MYA-4686) TaxID=486041 RepID=B0DKU3_LACBS|nr:uncharacterized protein LACBIDRAFT_330294 [Laccaria bicolor S238N-H82]EDR04799.1 predicted protein [Laccaria bicolor S238N-H82]|eukprot:XP_001884623.1 predicted protein [Laccaria bicolor S238N-H82]
MTDILTQIVERGSCKATMIIRYHVVTPGDPDDLFWHLLQMCTYHMDNGRGLLLEDGVGLSAEPFSVSVWYNKFFQVSRQESLAYGTTILGFLVRSIMGWGFRGARPAAELLKKSIRAFVELLVSKTSKKETCGYFGYVSYSQLTAANREGNFVALIYYRMILGYYSNIPKHVLKCSGRPQNDQCDDGGITTEQCIIVSSNVMRLEFQQRPRWGIKMQVEHYLKMNPNA